MELIVAVRLHSVFHGKTGFEYQGATVVDYHIEKRDPALKNVQEALFRNKLKHSVDGCGLYWFRINIMDDLHSAELFRSFNEVEICILSEEFERLKREIRGLKGEAYCNACAAFTETLPIKDQTRTIKYNYSRRTQAA